MRSPKADIRRPSVRSVNVASAESGSHAAAQFEQGLRSLSSLAPFPALLDDKCGERTVGCGHGSTERFLDPTLARFPFASQPWPHPNMRIGPP